MARVPVLVPAEQSVFNSAQRFFASKMASRAPHHGWEHATRVLDWSLRLTPASSPYRREIITLALLHDVLDHKFTDVSQADFDALVGEELMPGPDAQCERDMLSNAIAAVSFSKEKKNGARWFEATLDAKWLAVRDGVSDADKVRSMGGRVGGCWCRFASSLTRASARCSLDTHVL